MVRMASAALAATLLISGPAAAVTLNFSQNGYSEGASITGSFTGEDTNMDGVLSSLDGELSDFSASFSGNSVVEAFSLTLGDIISFVFDLNAGDVLGDGLNEGIISDDLFDDDEGGYITGRGPLGAFACLLFPCGAVTGEDNDLTNSQVIVSSGPVAVVPLPQSVWFMLAALVGLGVVGRARRAQSVGARSPVG